MTRSGRLKEIRKAFAKRDIQASALLHSPGYIAQAAQEQHGGASVLLGKLPDRIFGSAEEVVGDLQFL